MRQALVFGQPADQIEQRGGVVNDGGTDGNHAMEVRENMVVRH
jgi:hypothetical protein